MIRLRITMIFLVTFSSVSLVNVQLVSGTNTVYKCEQAYKRFRKGERSPGKVITECEVLAKKGEPKAQFNLGQMYIHSRNPNPNIELAIKSLEECSSQKKDKTTQKECQKKLDIALAKQNKGAAQEEVQINTKPKVEEEAHLKVDGMDSQSAKGVSHIEQENGPTTEKKEETKQQLIVVNNGSSISSVQDPDLKDDLNRAKFYMDTGNLKEAKDVYLEIIRKQARHEEANTNLATIYYFKKNYESAINICRDLMDWYPDNPEPRQRLGQIYMDNKKFDESIHELELLVSIIDDNAKYYNDFATAYAMNGDWDKAEEYYTKSIALDPYDSLPHKNLGYTYYKKKMWSNAINEFLTARNINIYTFGNEASLIKTLKESKSHYKKLVKEKTDNAMAHYYLGYTYAFDANWKDAHKELKKAIEIDPGVSKFYETRGMFFQSQGSNSKALKLYNKCIETDPSNWVCYMGMGEIYNEIMEFDTALDNMKKAENINTNIYWIKQGLGAIYINLNEYEKAYDCYKEAEALDPDSLPAYLGLCNTNYYLKKYDSAWKYALRLKNMGWNQINPYIKKLEAVSDRPY